MFINALNWVLDLGGLCLDGWDLSCASQGEVNTKFYGLWINNRKLYLVIIAMGQLAVTVDIRALGSMRNKKTWTSYKRSLQLLRTRMKKKHKSNKCSSLRLYLPLIFLNKSCKWEQISTNLRKTMPRSLSS